MSTESSPPPGFDRIGERIPLKKRIPLVLQKRALPSEGGNEIWLLTLSDLLMLLMIFFVLLFAVLLHRQHQAVATTLPAAPQPPGVQTKPPDARPVPPGAVPSEPPREATARLAADLANLLDQGEQGITVERRTHTIVVTFPERIIFDSGRSELKDAVQPQLVKVARFLRDHGNVAIEIHGHTDDRPIRSPRFPSNWELSADRATQVAKTLVKLGLHPARLSVRGFGEHRPCVANDSDLNRSKNRRVEIQFSLQPA